MATRSVLFRKRLCTLLTFVPFSLARSLPSALAPPAHGAGSRLTIPWPRHAPAQGVFYLADCSVSATGALELAITAKDSGRYVPPRSGAALAAWDNILGSHLIVCA